MQLDYQNLKTRTFNYFFKVIIYNCVKLTRQSRYLDLQLIQTII
jgi:hypothetical protein